MISIDSIIKKYDLKPHPEGGYFREIYRSAQEVISPISNETRNAATHIYFLLRKGQFSRFHRVLHDEIWNFYEGSALKLFEFDGKTINESIIGEKGKYVSVIKGGLFQAAETTGDYTLVGCTVAPGFDFNDFSFISDEADALNRIHNQFPNYAYLL
jgi:predicted cupin superfamily sugar epimerase